MGLKYYVPKNHEDLAGCEGFYIENLIFYGTNDFENSWDGAVGSLAKKLKSFLPQMKIVNDWQSEMGICRYVLLESDDVQIITGDDERYFSIFVIIPEKTVMRDFVNREYEQVCNVLRSYLLRTFSEVSCRKNTWNLELITEKRRRTV